MLLDKIYDARFRLEGLELYLGPCSHLFPKPVKVSVHESLQGVLLSQSLAGIYGNATRSTERAVVRTELGFESGESKIGDTPRQVGGLSQSRVQRFGTNLDLANATV